MFGIAMGVLGYTADESRRMRVVEIMNAFRAKIQWTRMCNGDDVRSPAQKIADQLRKIGK